MLKSLFYFILFYFILFYTFAFSILNFHSKPKIQMKQTFNFLLMLVMVATVLSCKKTEPTPELTPAQKIVGKYKMTVNTATINGVVTNRLAGRPTCELDNITEFTTDGKYIDSEGATSCTPARNTETLFYTVSVDGKTLTLTDVGRTGSSIYAIVELTDTLLKQSITYNYIDRAGVATVEKQDFTFTKI